MVSLIGDRAVFTAGLPEIEEIVGDG